MLYLNSVYIIAEISFYVDFQKPIGGIHMANKISLGVYKSTQDLTKAFADVVTVPYSIKPIDFSSGLMNEGQKNQLAWANLTAVDPELLKQFESIGQEEYCPTFKVKLKGYKGEDITTLLGKEITFTEYEIAFIFDKFKQPIGLSLVLELSSISFI